MTTNSGLFFADDFCALAEKSIEIQISAAAHQAIHSLTLLSSYFNHDVCAVDLDTSSDSAGGRRSSDEEGAAAALTGRLRIFIERAEGLSFPSLRTADTRFFSSSAFVRAA